MGPVVPVRAVEHLISRSYGPSMARSASILGQKPWTKSRDKSDPQPLAYL